MTDHGSLQPQEGASVPSVQEDKPAGHDSDCAPRAHPDKTAFRAVDACGGTYSAAEETSGWAQGHRDALADAMQAVKSADDLTTALLTALQHIADLAPVIDQQTGCADDAAQETARAAIAKATGASRALGEQA